MLNFNHQQHSTPMHNPTAQAMPTGLDMELWDLDDIKAHLDSCDYDQDQSLVEWSA